MESNPQPPQPVSVASTMKKISDMIPPPPLKKAEQNASDDDAEDDDDWDE